MRVRVPHAHADAILERDRDPIGEEIVLGHGREWRDLDEPVHPCAPH
jgi:hypothetical protein